MRRILLVVVVLFAGVLTSCGGGDGDSDSAGSGEERSVLVDFRHDEFAAAFLQYYPEQIKVRPGDTIQFRQAWTGEPHSVTLGKIVDEFIDVFPQLEEYETVDEARAGGVPADVIDRAVESYARLPAMSDRYQTIPAGSEPCYVDKLEDAPIFRDADTDVIDLKATCPAGGKKQPKFTGRQALYNSGFIPYTGERGNTFTVPIAEDATPGTYQYYCNYHFIFMGGSVEVVEKGADIPSQSEVSKQARKEIDADAAKALKTVGEANAKRVGDTIRETSRGPEGESVREVPLPLSGRATQDDTPVIINEFFPRKLNVKANQKVTWTFDGSLHTVSFNVPKYFPIFTIADAGKVEWDSQAYEPRGWDLDYELRTFGPVEPEPVQLDAGKWDGKGGFHSSGALLSGDTFSVTFTKAGTYPFACVLHPQMVGTLVVTA
jgi:plastocyanin